MRDTTGEAGLVPVQSSALLRVNSASLAQRGAQDLFAAEQAEQCFHEGQEQYSRQEFDQAVLSFKRGLDFNPNHVEMRTSLGDLYTSGLLSKDDFREAFVHFGIAADPGNAEAQGALAGMTSGLAAVGRRDPPCLAAFSLQKWGQNEGPNGGRLTAESTQIPIFAVSSIQFTYTSSC
jgi:hypothetical protein